jgi:beta-glucosidase
MTATPSIGIPGSSITLRETLPNPAGAAALHNVTMNLSGPDGWTVQASSPTTFATLPGGQTVQSSWQVTIPAGTGPGAYSLSGEATFDAASGSQDAEAGTQVSVPYASLAAALDNAGISDDSATSAGNLDGGGMSYSAQTLATDGLAPGATVSHDGLGFIWPDATPGSNDNVVASGQTIAISGSGGALGIIGTGDYGTADGTGTVTYTDGTTQAFTLSLPDWYSNAAPPGGDIVDTFPYHNTRSGRGTQSVSLYYVPIALQADKQVADITLPDVSGGVATNQTAMHIFAMAIGSASQPLGAHSAQARAPAAWAADAAAWAQDRRARLLSLQR